MIERAPAPWLQVAEHPEVAEHIYTAPFDLASVVTHPEVLPLWCGGGGFLFHRQGDTYDLHALFLPERWGRPVSDALRAALAAVFGLGATEITASEVEGWWRSRPPRSFGFRPVTDFRPQHGLSLRQWSLTLAAWEASPVRRRAQCRQS